MTVKRLIIRVSCMVIISAGFLSVIVKLSKREVKVFSERQFFKDKHVTEDGVYPLPGRSKFETRRSKNSVVPQKFFRNKEDVSSHDYEWILNPFLTCVAKSIHPADGDSDEIFLLVAIASASREFERRELIRNTWASVRFPYGKEVKYVFFVGIDHKSEYGIMREFEKYNDIVLESYEDTYKNLTIKTQGQLKWATYFCPNARYVMHVDDDVFADVRGMVKHLVAQNERRLLHCGKVFKPKVRRDGKWKMTEDEYRGEQYPLSCVGWCFVMSQPVVNDLYFTSINTHLIHLEDVTFTGILREKVGNLEPVKIPDGEKLCRHVGWPKDRPTNDKLMDAWKEIQTNSKFS